MTQATAHFEKWVSVSHPAPKSTVRLAREVLAMIRPAIRSDYTAIERYQHEPGRRLDCPLTVLTGDSDPRVSREEAEAWAEHTTATSETKVFRGGHFFLAVRAAEAIDLVARRLGGTSDR